MDGVKDSHCVDFGNALDALQRNLTTPREGGARGNDADKTKLHSNLKDAMVSIATSPLSQRAVVEPVPGPTGPQIQALRNLYAAVMKEPPRTEGFPTKEIEAALKEAGKFLRGEEVKQIGDPTIGDSNRPIHPTTNERMTRLKKATSYHELVRDMEEELFGGVGFESDEEDGLDGDDELDEDDELGEDENREMDGVEKV